MSKEHLASGITTGFIALALVGTVALRGSSTAQGSLLPTPITVSFHTQSLPIKLEIPNLHIDANIENVGLTASGAMDVPKAWQDTAWYDLGPRPGETGNAVIAGHLDSDSGPAVFWNLHELNKGDSVMIQEQDGKILRFVVTDNKKFTDQNTDLQTIFGTATGAHLNLITCGGPWDAKAQHYTERRVVFTTLAE